MSGLNAMLAECEKWVDAGYVEGPGNNETVFGKWYGDDFEPWCDQWISFCGAMSGNSDAVGRFEYCPSHVNFFKGLDQWGDDPRVGALVFYSWDQNGVADHVGIIIDFDDDAITTYEGNTSPDSGGSQGNGGGAYKRTRPRNGLILGYGYPAYAADDSSPNPAPAPEVTGPAWPGEYLRLTHPMQHDSNVEALQGRMRDRGWTIGVDGYFGPQTDKVVRAFQSEKGLTCDGIVGPVTWAAAFRTDNVT